MQITTATVLKHFTIVGAVVIGSEAIWKVMKHGKADKAMLMPVITILVAGSALAYSLQTGVPKPLDQFIQNPVKG